MLVRHGALVLAVSDPTQITVNIPTAKYLRYKNKDIVAVKHTLESAKILRNLGLDAPSPILYDGFIFGGRYKPMIHQTKTAEFLTLHNRAFVFNTMGTGKTSAALWSLDYLKQRGFIRKILIIAPLSVMDVWMHEMFLTLPNRSSVQLVGKRERRVELLNSGSEICVINYDGVVSICDDIKKWKPDLIIVDEASAYCNPQTQRYKALKKILQVQTRLWLLTGTPIPNAPTDAYGLIRLVAPSTVPPSFGLFRDTLMNRYGPYKWVPKPGALDTVYDLMQPAIRFTKKECLDLPPITHNFRQCDMSAKQLEVFNDVRMEMKHVEEESGAEVKAVNAATKLIKLQQIMCGIVKDQDGNPIDLDPKPRLTLVDEIVAQAEAKVIIFVPFIYAMHLVQNYLSPKYETAIVNGTVGKAAREEIFRTFQTTNKIKVLIAHPKVAAHGLTLTAANTIIWYAPIFSIDQYIQANARIERTGQKLSMSIYNLYCHAVEHAIYNLLQARESLQAKVLELYEDALA